MQADLKAKFQGEVYGAALKQIRAEAEYERLCRAGEACLVAIVVGIIIVCKSKYIVWQVWICIDM